MWPYSPAVTPVLAHCAGVRLMAVRSPARIRRTSRAHHGGLEQLVDVGSANRAVVAAAQTHVLDGRPLDPELVGVGLAAQRIARIPVARFRRQVIRAREVVHDGQAHFSERLPDVQSAVDRLRRGAARLKAVGEDVVRIELELLFAIFGADVDRQAVLRSRDLDAVLAEVARNGSVADVFGRQRCVRGRNRQVGELRLGDAARGINVPRNAGRSRAARERRSAHRSADRHAGYAAGAQDWRPHSARSQSAACPGSCLRCPGTA